MHALETVTTCNAWPNGITRYPGDWSPSKTIPEFTNKMDGKEISHEEVELKSPFPVIPPVKDSKWWVEIWNLFQNFWLSGGFRILWITDFVKKRYSRFTLYIFGILYLFRWVSHNFSTNKTNFFGFVFSHFSARKY